MCFFVYHILYSQAALYIQSAQRKKRTRRRSKRRNGGCVKSSFYVFFFYSQFVFSLVFSQVCSHSNPNDCLSLRNFGARLHNSHRSLVKMRFRLNLIQCYMHRKISYYTLHFRLFFLNRVLLICVAWWRYFQLCLLFVCVLLNLIPLFIPYISYHFQMIASLRRQW